MTTKSELKKRKTFSSKMMYVLYRNAVLKESTIQTMNYLKHSEHSLTADQVKIIRECLENKEKYKVLIEPYLVKWRWDRLPAIDKAVLLLGTHFIVNSLSDDIYIINICLEMIKQYGEYGNYAYVNAVLDKILKKKEEDGKKI